MRPVDIGVTHDDHAVVAGLGRIEGTVALVVADARAHGGDDGADFVVVEDLVDPRFLHIDELAAEGGGWLGSGGRALVWRSRRRNPLRR